MTEPPTTGARAKPEEPQKQRTYFQQVDGSYREICNLRRPEREVLAAHFGAWLGWKMAGWETALGWLGSYGGFNGFQGSFGSFNFFGVTRRERDGRAETFCGCPIRHLRFYCQPESEAAGAELREKLLEAGDI